MTILDNSIYVGNYIIDINQSYYPYTEEPCIEFLISKSSSSHYCKCFNTKLEDAYNWCISQEDYLETTQ